MAREADLEDAKKLLDSGRSLVNPKKMVMDTLDPTGSVEDEARDLQSAVTADAPADAPADTPDGETAEQGQGDKPQTASDKEPAKKQPPKQQQKPAKAATAQKTAEKTAQETNQETKQEAAQATVVKQPVNVAPPHSLTPPSEPGAKAKAKKPDTEPASPDGSQNTA
jgi:hypothetical protein